MNLWRFIAKIWPRKTKIEKQGKVTSEAEDTVTLQLQDGDTKGGLKRPLGQVQDQLVSRKKARSLNCIRRANWKLDQDLQPKTMTPSGDEVKVRCAGENCVTKLLKKNQRPIVCYICSNNFHQVCTSLTRQELSTAKTDDWTWLCNKCKTASAAVNVRTVRTAQRSEDLSKTAQTSEDIPRTSSSELSSSSNESDHETKISNEKK